MKKRFLLMVSVLSLTIASIAQTTIPYGMSLGISATNIDCLDASSTGLIIGFDIMNIYMEFAGNMASGTGKHLEWSTDETYLANKKNWWAVNVGWSITPFQQKDKPSRWFITPKIGYMQVNNIYNDPVAINTYFIRHDKGYFNAGVDITYLLTDYLFIRAGGGNRQIMSGTIGFVLY